MKTPALLLATLIIALLPSRASAQTAAASANLETSIGLRVACFSPQRAFSESADGKAALTRLATLETEKGPHHRREEQSAPGSGTGARADRPAIDRSRPHPARQRGGE